MNIFEKIWDWVIVVFGLLLLLVYGILFELFTFWRYALPENHWLRVKLEGTMDL